MSISSLFLTQVIPFDCENAFSTYKFIQKTLHGGFKKCSWLIKNWHFNDLKNRNKKVKQ